MEQATFRNLILRDVEAANAEEAIRKVGQRFYDEGFVKDTYIDAVVAREKNYATGLQLADIAVAMPHTDPQHVNRPGVCIAQLKHPVEFEHMGDPDTKVQAEMLFMMAIKNPDEQVELLQKVLGVFQQPEVVAAFQDCGSVQNTVKSNLLEGQMMKTCNILCVCGSGTVSSAMVAGKLKERLKEKGWDAAMVEASPNSISTEITGKKFDLIACVSPVYEDFGIPKVKAVGMLTGLSEDKVVDDCLKILEANA